MNSIEFLTEKLWDYKILALHSVPVEFHKIHIGVAIVVANISLVLQQERSHLLSSFPIASPPGIMHVHGSLFIHAAYDFGKRIIISREPSSRV